MSIKPCTSEYMFSTVNGIAPRKRWFPGQPVKEVMLESTKDGEISRSPDPVTMISGDIDFYNNTPDQLAIQVQVFRAPRSIVAQNPSTVLIQDAWSWRKGSDPRADYPSVMQDGFGGRTQIDRPETSAKDLSFGRLFLDGDSSCVWVDCGVLPVGHLLHFRYIASVQTPGTFTSPSEFEGRWEAHARYTRLRVHAGPVGSM